MLPPRTRVGEYRVVRFVAEGKTSTVYEGRHSTRGGTVAIKVLNPEWCIHPEVVARFLNEAQTLQELHHPHLVKGLDRGVLREGPPFMVLEWQPEDLDRALTRVGGRLPARECAQVVRQLAEVLALLHVRGVVHRDLKPANVLVAHREPGAWRVQLADLGLAKRLASVGQGELAISTAGSALLGTWDYMPPEQWVSAKNVGARADIYALGILWFQLLAGRLPFVGEEQSGLMFQHVGKKPPLELIAERAPESTRTMIARMLGKKPEQRPSVEEVLALVSAPPG